MDELLTEDAIPQDEVIAKPVVPPKGFRFSTGMRAESMASDLPKKRHPMFGKRFSTQTATFVTPARTSWGNEPFPSRTPDTIWNRMLRQESGHQQFDAKGRPKTSPKGAIGIAQVMPGTARSMAKRLGIEFDEFKYRNDRDYNERLGREYFSYVSNMFKDPVLAVAAYNAGEGSVQRWLRPKALGGLGDPRKGQISIEEWARRIPFKETRDYVSKIMKI